MIFVTIAFVTDVRKAVIPNILTISGAVVGIMLNVSISGMNGLTFSLIGAGSALMAMFLLYLIGALGAGDVKLFTAIGAMMGFSFVFQLMLYSILCAALIGLVLLLMHKQMAETGLKLMKWLFSIIVLHDLNIVKGMKRDANIKFPFMYAVMPAVAMTWYYSI
ncbi:A24 family peptidase [Paenibacillus sp. MAH-36]|uniref:A24 family peptidase n=1 Tax=Paenibacillus violae TaxID=3077234 RepID=A0ABU3R7K3_9BACL|nr:A24 family peptidase [Paenibacillus sp. PFR10]MDU0200227.1 A24 family peptidase [Paenibacillus sp. PFR10]